MDTQKKPLFLEERVGNIEEKLEKILRILERHSGRMTMDEIASFWGVKKSSLYKGNRYLLPDFGKKIPHNGYTREEVYAWAEKGEEALFREWKGK